MAIKRCIAPSVLFLEILLGASLLCSQEPEFPIYDLRPYLQSLTTTSVLIASQSKEMLVARLEYGPTSAMELKLEDPAPAHDHLFRLEGLEPGTKYYYKVAHGDEVVASEASFRTLPPPGSEVTVAVIGDSGSGTKEQLAIAGLMEEFAPDLLVHAGDIVYELDLPDLFYERFFSVYQQMLLSTCIYPTLGNHDCFLPPDYWLYVFHLPANNPANDESYYSFDAGDAHFATVNSCSGDVAEVERAWLAADMRSTARRWKIVFFHHPPYSDAQHQGDSHVRAQLVPLLEELGVDLVLCGHEHVYERTYPVLRGVIRDGYQDPDYISPRGVLYVVSGGGGGELYDFSPSPEVGLSAVFHSKHHYVALRVTADEIQGKAIGLDRSVLDAFSIRKGPSRPMVRFIRGDANQDGKFVLADCVAILEYLFSVRIPPCLAACDVDASGTLEITDAIHALNFLFRGGPAPTAPFPECGSAAIADDTGCIKACQ